MNEERFCDSGPRLPNRLSALDAIFLNFERPTQLMHISSILIFDGALDFERLIADLDARIHQVSRYTDRVMPVPFGLAHPTWEPDPDFDIRAHVHRRVLRGPGSDEQLAELCSVLYGQPLNRRHPLWELYLIDGYRGNQPASWSVRNGRGARAQSGADESNGSARSALFLKVHHSMIDGVSGVQLLGILLDAHPRPSSVTPVSRALCPPLPGPASRLASGVLDRISTGVKRGRKALNVLAHPSRTIQHLGDTTKVIGGALRSMLVNNTKTPLTGVAAGGRSLAWLTLSLNDIKAIKNRLGGSVNDVVLAVVSGALRRVLDERGINPDRLELRAFVPVNVRSADEFLQLGNHLSIMVAPLPVGILDPVERLRQVRAATALLKKRDEAARMERIVRLTDLIPPSVQQVTGWALRVPVPVDTICTNVPGPPVVLYMQGRSVERMMPFVPLIEGMGVAFATLSYADTLTVGLTVDTALMPDLQDVIAPLHASFEELWAATGLERAQQPDTRTSELASAATEAPVYITNGAPMATAADVNLMHSIADRSGFVNSLPS